MSSSDFRQIAIGADDERPERLFRATVSAFCSLTRPTRQEIAQLDELALSLYDQVSPDSLRYVAAALSDLPHAPSGLVGRLAMEEIEIAAPLLLRSPVLPDAMLIMIIARRGLSHARAIARRTRLEPAISALIRALEASTGSAPDVGGAESDPCEPPLHVAAEPAQPRPADIARDRLRVMMADAGAGTPGAMGDAIAALPPARYETLMRTALSGSTSLFQTALADALDIEFRSAGQLLSDGGRNGLMLVLAGLELSTSQAFLLVACCDPFLFSSRGGVRAFVEDYQAIDAGTGQEEIRRLRASRLAALTSPFAGRTLKAL